MAFTSKDKKFITELFITHFGELDKKFLTKKEFAEFKDQFNVLQDAVVGINDKLEKQNTSIEITLADHEKSIETINPALSIS